MNSQAPTADKVFGAVIQKPAWKYRPSWYMVADRDYTINPEFARL
ncbi:hypothetical protein ACHRV1_24980 [Flavobacterium aquidurense]